MLGIVLKSLLTGVLAVVLAVVLFLIVLTILGFILFSFLSHPSTEGQPAIGFDLRSLFGAEGSVILLVLIFAAGFLWGFRHFTKAAH